MGLVVGWGVGEGLGECEGTSEGWAGLMNEKTRRAVLGGGPWPPDGGR